MMQKHTKMKQGAAICAAVVIGYLLLYLGSILYAVAVDREWAVMGILGAYGLLILAVIVGVVLALRQRWAEIDKGEEDIAKQY